jgi:hypothetical protein
MAHRCATRPTVRPNRIFIEGQDMSVEDAEAFARAILAAVTEARS